MQYELNMSKAEGLNWNGTEPKWIHWGRVALGHCGHDEAIRKGRILRDAMGADYKVNLTSTAAVTYTRIEL